MSLFNVSSSISIKKVPKKFTIFGLIQTRTKKLFIFVMNLISIFKNIINSLLHLILITHNIIKTDFLKSYYLNYYFDSYQSSSENLVA